MWGALTGLQAADIRAGYAQTGRAGAGPGVQGQVRGGTGAWLGGTYRVPGIWYQGWAHTSRKGSTWKEAASRIWANTESSSCGDASPARGRWGPSTGQA